MMPAGRHSELRNSVRFPLRLHVSLKTPHGELHAETCDISAGGVLFHLNTALEVGSPAEFAIEMPAEMLGTSDAVHVICKGRVVRCLQDASGQSVAVVIDEYHFKRLQRSEGQ
jgi:hypothetical protein